MSLSPAFQGSGRKLVLAFDVGTTYSGISYSILDPGQIPEIKGVTRFPGHEHVGSSSKIPTIIYYDGTGEVRAVGAEVLRDDIYETAKEKNWIKAEWFKLHLRSKYGGGTHVTDQIPPLPLNKTVIEVLADFLKYLFECTSSYIQSTHANGPDLWKSVTEEIDFILSHPNGWEGTEQAQMRKAAVSAGLIPDSESGHARLSFVTEGEASLYFSIRHGLPEGVMKNGEGVVIVDAGGGTIDVSSYSRSIEASVQTFEEISVPQCYFHGSVFVTIHARLFLDKFLAKSPFVDDVEYIVQIFDHTTKLRFKEANDPQYIKFGSARDNDPTSNIRFGQLKLEGSDVASFFRPSVDCIVNAVLEQRKQAKKPIYHVVIVGGFAASAWLYSQVQIALAPSRLTLLVPESPVNKAVSDGAISFYLNHFVRTRISKFTYGTVVTRDFDPTAPDHLRRATSVYTNSGGEKRVPDGFNPILPKDTQVSESTEFKRSFYRHYYKSWGQVKITSGVWCYRGTIQNPRWRDEDAENFQQLCSIEGDLSHLQVAHQINKESGKTYYRVPYSIVLLFGLTELKAQISWIENGVEKRSPAKIIYDPDL